MTGPDATLPLEGFITAVQSQLDNAQTMMAVKARRLNLPLTFAVKDITFDLRAHVDFDRGQVRLRPAGPSETEASILHFVFTAITKPMIEENAVTLAEAPEDESIDNLHDELSDEDRRKLEWIGVRTVDKLREAEKDGSLKAVGRFTNLPVDRLRKALERASTPQVREVLPIAPVAGDPDDLAGRLRVRGRNLVRDGMAPRVAIDGRPVAILKSADDELLLAPDASQWAGELRIEPAPQVATAMSFDLTPFAPRNGLPREGVQ